MQASAGKIQAHNDVAGLIVAGGRSVRMAGEDKALLPLTKYNLLQTIIATVQPQVGALYLNANGELSRFTDFNLPIINDVLPDYAGPLVGLYSGLKAIAEKSEAVKWVLAVPCDAPFIPEDLVVRLIDEVEPRVDDAAKNAVVVSYQGELQPTFALWNVRILPALKEAIDSNVRSFKGFLDNLEYQLYEWPEQEINPFFNINTPEQLNAAREIESLRSNSGAG